MKFFLDTANLDDIISATEMGLIDGVTTNPSLVAREGKEFLPLVSEICRIVHGPVSLETVSPDADGMMKEARDLASIGENVVVKIPVTIEGLKAIRVLESEGVATGTTLVFSPSQGLLAAKAGTRYVIPFLGRLDDISAAGIGLAVQIQEILSNYGFDAEVLAASVRNPGHVTACALSGVPIVTAPLNVYKQMAGHPLTDIGIQRFLADWESAKAEL